MATGIVLQLVGVLRVSTLKAPSSGKKGSPEHRHGSIRAKRYTAGASLSPFTFLPPSSPIPATLCSPVASPLHCPSPRSCTDLPVAHNNDDDYSNEEHQSCRRGADDERQLLLDAGLVLSWHMRKREWVTAAQDGSTLTSSSRSEHGPEHCPRLHGSLMGLLAWFWSRTASAVPHMAQVGYDGGCAPVGRLDGAIPFGWESLVPWIHACCALLLGLRDRKLAWPVLFSSTNVENRGPGLHLSSSAVHMKITNFVSSKSN